MNNCPFCNGWQRRTVFPERSVPKVLFFLILTCMFLKPAKAHTQELSHLEMKSFPWASNLVTDTFHIKKLYEQAASIAEKNLDSGIIMFRNVLNLSRRMNDNYATGQSVLAISTCYRQKWDYEKAIKIGKEAYPYCLLANNSKLYLKFYSQMSEHYASMGFNDTVILYSHKAIALLQQHPEIDSSREYLFNHYHHLGRAYLALVHRNFDLAVHYFEKAKQIAIEQKNTTNLMSAYIALGAAYANKLPTRNQSTADYKKGLEYSEKAINLGKATGYTAGLGTAYCNIGTIYINLGNLDSGEFYINKALADQEYLKSTPGSSIRPYLALGAAYYKKKNNTRAETLLLQAATASTAMGSKNDLLEIYAILSQIYIQDKRYERALVYQQAYSLLRDSLISEEKVNATAQLEVKYQTAEKDRELALKNLKLSQQQSQLREKNIWIGAGLCSSLLLAGFLFFWRRNSQHRRQGQEEKFRIMQQEQQLWKQGEEIRNLNAMVKGEEKERARLGRDLHDGIVSQLAAVKMNFDTLQLKYPVPEAEQEYQKALQHLEDTAMDLRKTAHNLMPGILIEHGLALSLESYCEKTANFTGLDIRFIAEDYIPRMDIDFELSLYRMVQELVQNIVKHAQASKALVQLDYHKPLLIMTVEDDGRGIEPETTGAKGIGLSNLQSRVHALQGHFDIKGRKNNGTSVYLEFDLSVIESSTHT